MRSVGVVFGVGSVGFGAVCVRPVCFGSTGLRRRLICIGVGCVMLELLGWISSLHLRCICHSVRCVGIVAVDFGSVGVASEVSEFEQLVLLCRCLIGFGVSSIWLYQVVVGSVGVVSVIAMGSVSVGAVGA